MPVYAVWGGANRWSARNVGMGIGKGCFFRMPIRHTEITIEGMALALHIRE